MITVVELNQIEAINAIRDDWHALLAESSRASFFHTPEWLEAYWKFFSADQQLKILVVRSEEQTREKQTIGIVPLLVRTVPSIVGQIRLLTSFDDWGDFNKPIGNDQPTIIQAACEYLKNSPRNWDIFEPRWVDDAGLQYGEVFSAMKKGGGLPYVSEWSSAAMVDLSGTIEEYWNGWSSKNRSEQRRNERRLAQRGDIKYLRHRPKPEGDPRWDLFEDCKQIAKESWQAESKTGTTLSHESVQNFMRYVHEMATHLGRLDLNLLYQDEKPIAFSYGYHFRGYVDGLKTGYVREKKTNGAGRVLVARIIEDSFERGDQTFNMGSEQHAWKKIWRTESAITYQYAYFSSKSPKGQFLKMNHWAKKSWQYLRKLSGSKKQEENNNTQQKH